MTPNQTVTVNYGESQTYTFTSNTGYHLSSVAIDGVELTKAEVEEIAINGYTFENINRDHIISAIFAINMYTISTSIEGSGLVTPSNTQVQYGVDQTLKFTPATGYAIESVYIDGMNLGAISERKV